MQSRNRFYESTYLKFSQQYQSVEWKHHVQTPIVRNKNFKLFQGFVCLMIHKVILLVHVFFYRTLKLSFFYHLLERLFLAIKSITSIKHLIW